MIEVLDLDDLPPPLPAPNGFRYRGYQEQSFDAIEAGWLEFKRQVLVQATGTGKTEAFAYETKRWVARGLRVLILAHAEELLDQAARKLERSTGLIAAKEKAADHASLSDMVVVASIQTLAKDSRLNGWPPDHFGLIVVDECHRSLAASYQKVLGYFTGKVLGVTATADRGDKQSLSKFYERIAFQYDLRQACLDGWLVRPTAKTLPIKIDLNGVKSSRTSEGSDYDLGEVSHRIAPFLMEIARQTAIETAGRNQGVVFLPSIDTASIMADCLRDCGMNADYVSGQCPDRTEKMARFKAGEIGVLCNAMLLIEGFDHDAIDWICVLRPTKIRSLYVQAVGRGTRPLNPLVPQLNAATSAAERCAIIEASAKPNLLILDFLWLTEKLDLVKPAEIMARNDKVAAKMRESKKDGDLLDLEIAAARDLLDSLEKAVAKNKKKKARVIDPLVFAVSIKDEDLETYEPSSRWEFAPPSPEQKKYLADLGINPEKVPNAGYASKLIDKALQRKKLGLCSVAQMSFLERLGYKDAALVSFEEARRITIDKMAHWRRKK